MERKFDIIIFGASGSTGELVVEELASKTFQENIRWAVAGRNDRKMQQTLAEVQKRLDPDQDLKAIRIFEADVTDKESLELMCENTKLLINCVGPYEKYGEPVLKACLKCRTHSIDMTVEMAYINHIMLKYNREAESQEVYIINSCGIGYLFFEMAIQLLRQRYEGRIQNIDVFITPELKFRSVHFATWNSIVNMSNGLGTLLVSRKKICSDMMKSKIHIPDILFPVKPSREAKGIGFIFPPFLHPSHIGLGIMNKEKPIKFNYYWTIHSITTLIILVTVALFLICLFPFRAGRLLMTKYPGFFSCGLVKKSEGSEEMHDTSNLNFTAVATGRIGKQRKYNGPEIPKGRAILYGRSPPGYKTAAICLVQTALTVLQESDHLPKSGGIYTPLAAFGKTSLPSRLQNNGITYKEEKSDYLTLP